MRRRRKPLAYTLERLRASKEQPHPSMEGMEDDDPPPDPIEAESINARVIQKLRGKKDASQFERFIATQFKVSRPDGQGIRKGTPDFKVRQVWNARVGGYGSTEEVRDMMAEIGFELPQRAGPYGPIYWLAGLVLNQED